MRVLYVALTRAKEKLIITGSGKDVLKKLENKRELYNIYNSNNKKINPILVKKFSSYLDWIELVSFSEKSKDLINIQIHNKKDISLGSKKEIGELPKFNFNKEINFEEIHNRLNFEYKYNLATTLPSKSTVSKIKEMYYENDGVDFEMISKQEVGLEKIEPQFLKEKDEKITSSRKGTLIHLILQKINFKEEYNLEKLKKLVNKLVYKKVITVEEANSISLNKILNFYNSDFALNIKKAKEIQKEKPFCTQILAKDIYENATNETILVQGIIDLYFIDENDRLVLLDYKTDYVEFGKEEELIKKYKKQLEIYGKALSEALNQKVYKTYIYSIYLNKEFEVKF